MTARSGANQLPPAGLLAAASGRSRAEIAEAAGLSERSVTRRLADASVRRQVAEVRASMVAAATGRMAANATEAVDVLLEVARNRGVNPHARVSASTALLANLGRFIEITDISERLAAIEVRLDAEAKS